MVSDVIMIFEIVSPTSKRMDHFIKVREDRAVDSIRRYIIIESISIDVTVMERKEPITAWLTTTLTKDDLLHIPEVGIEIPVADLYEGMTFAEEEPSEV